MDITIFQNNRNPHKFFEVKGLYENDDGIIEYRQLIISFNKRMRKFVVNKVGDGQFQKYRKISFLEDFNDDYHYYKHEEKIERIIKHDTENN